MDLLLKQFNAFFYDWQQLTKKEPISDNHAIQKINLDDFLSFTTQFNQLLTVRKTHLTDSILLQFEEFIRTWQAFPSSTTEYVEPLEIYFTLPEVTQFFTSFNECYQQHKEKGYLINIWDICGIKRDEVKHCQVLRWLLDPNESHGLNESFFEFMVNQFNWSWFKPIDKNYKVKTEISYDTQSSINNNSRDLAEENNSTNSRVDIQIENDHAFVIIEVKIDAAETGDQIMRYCRIAEAYSKYNGNKAWKIIYLTRNRSKPVNYQEYDKLKFEQHLTEDIICLAWSDFARVIDKFISISTSINPFMQQLLPQYSQYINRNF